MAEEKKDAPKKAPATKAAAPKAAEKAPAAKAAPAKAAAPKAAAEKAPAAKAAPPRPLLPRLLPPSRTTLLLPRLPRRRLHPRRHRRPTFRRAPRFSRCTTLRPAAGAKKDKTRVGRGEGSKGKTAGRGTKGTKARYSVRPGFEGGQPELRHVRRSWCKPAKNPFRVEYQVVNLEKLAELYPKGGDVTIGDLVLKGPFARTRRSRFSVMVTLRLLNVAGYQGPWLCRAEDRCRWRFGQVTTLLYTCKTDAPPPDCII